MNQQLSYVSLLSPLLPTDQILMTLSIAAAKWCAEGDHSTNPIRFPCNSFPYTSGDIWNTSVRSRHNCPCLSKVHTRTVPSYPDDASILPRSCHTNAQTRLSCPSRVSTSQRGSEFDKSAKLICSGSGGGVNICVRVETHLNSCRAAHCLFLYGV